MDRPPRSVWIDAMASVSNELICQWDRSSDLVSWHGNVGDYLGSPSESGGSDDLPSTFDQFLERVRSNRGEEVPDSFDAWLTSDRPFWCERLQLRGFDGRWIDVMASFRRVHDDEGEVVGAVGTILDVDRADRLAAPEESAERSNSEAMPISTSRDSDLYRALAENASDLITLLAPDGTIRYESPSLSRILGYQPEDLVGDNAFDHIHPDDRESVRKAWRRGLDDPENIGTVEYRCRHADGSWRHLESSGRRAPTGAEFDGILIHTRDVTERKRFEVRLLEAREMETIARLVAGIAHDFNNLLTVVQGDAELLLLELPDADPLRDQADEIAEAAQRGAALTRDLLAFGRQENLRFQLLDVAAALKAAIPEVEKALGDGVTVDFRSDPGPLWIRVDRALARQVLFELVLNAKAAMPEGGRFGIDLRRIQVGPESPLLGRGLSPGKWIAAGYSDTGAGMPEEVRARAIEPFYSTNEQRSGLGLSTVHGLVKQSGGEVWIESVPGEGTTVWTYLPDVGESAAVKAAAEAGAEDAAEAGM